MPIAHITRRGTLGVGAAALYTATNPGTFAVSITNAASQRTVALYVNHAGRSRIFRGDPMQAKASWPPAAPYGPIHLESGDSIDGDADVAGEVEWVITGIQLS